MVGASHTDARVRHERVGRLAQQAGRIAHQPHAWRRCRRAQCRRRRNPAPLRLSIPGLEPQDPLTGPQLVARIRDVSDSAGWDAGKITLGARVVSWSRSSQAPLTHRMTATAFCSKARYAIQEIETLQGLIVWRDPDLNRGHHDFQERNPRCSKLAICRAKGAWDGSCCAVMLSAICEQPRPFWASKSSHWPRNFRRHFRLGSDRRSAVRRSATAGDLAGS